MSLIYSATGSLDGYVADPEGDFQFAAPDSELHLFVNQVFARAGTLLMGRRTYDLMDYWDTLDLDDPENDPAEIAFAEHWRAAEKVVYSRTLASVSYPRTRLERDFDADAVRALIEHSDADVLIGGPHLAAEAFRAGLVEEVWAFLVPITIGSGLTMFPTDLRLSLDLVEHRRFGSGAVGMHYRVVR